MQTQCTPEQLEFSCVGRRRVVAAFDGGQVSSDAGALLSDPELARFTGRVSDSGEGRWTIKASIDEGVPTPVLTAALGEQMRAGLANLGIENAVPAEQSSVVCCALTACRPIMR